MEIQKVVCHVFSRKPYREMFSLGSNLEEVRLEVYYKIEEEEFCDEMALLLKDSRVWELRVGADAIRLLGEPELTMSLVQAASEASTRAWQLAAVDDQVDFLVKSLEDNFDKGGIEFVCR